MGEKIEWNDFYNIGVEFIDKAHQRLFSIVRKMLALNEDEEKQRHACKETIKYLKNYTIRHFEEEEAYMRSIDYSDYALHKRLHDNMKEKTVPALEQELEEQDYSPEAVQHFLGLCMGWLTGHIMIEDHAITGKVSHKWAASPNEEEINALESAIAQVMKEILGLESRLVSEHYRGENFGKGIFIRFTCLSHEGQRIQIFLAYEERLVLYMFSKMLGKKIHKVDKTVVYAIKELSKHVVDRIAQIYTPINTYKLEREDVLTYEQLLKSFEKEYPKYSLLYDTGGNGYFAFPIRE